MPAMQTATHPPHSDKAAAAEAAAQQLLAEEEREAAKAAAKKSKKQKQKVKKQLRQQQQQEQEEEASTAIPEEAGSPTTSGHEQQSNGLAAAVTAGDGMSAEAGGISQATPDAASQAPSGSDRDTHHPNTLVSDPEAMFSLPMPLHDLLTANSHGAAALHPRQGASGVTDASHAEDATTVTSSCGNLDMADTGQIARLLSCPITKVGPIAVRTSTFKLLGHSQNVCCCLLHSAAIQTLMMCLYSWLPSHAVLCCVSL